MELELGFVLRELLLGPLEFEGELARRVALTDLQVGLHLGLELGHVVAVAVHLPRDSLDERPILLEPFAALLHLIDGLVVLILQLRDRIGRPEEVGDLVHLRRKRLPELAEDHRGGLRGSDLSERNKGNGWLTGLEPATPRITI